MSDGNVTESQNYKLAVTPPEEGAGAAYHAVQEMLLKSLGIETIVLPMDLATRILTNGKSVPRASEYIKNDKNAIYVKGPGITPTDEQIIQAIIDLEKSNKLVFENQELNSLVKLYRDEMLLGKFETKLRKFAAQIAGAIKKIGSPNAQWRDSLEANLARGVSDQLSERSTATPPILNNNTPLSITAFEAKPENIGTSFLADETILNVTFQPNDGSAVITVNDDHKVSKGSSLRLLLSKKEEIQAWVRQEIGNLENGTEIAHGTKQTVLKTNDYAMIKWIQEELNNTIHIAKIAQDRKDPSKLGGLLIDDLFSRLSTTQLEKPLKILVPNSSYAKYVKDFWDGVKQSEEGFKVSKNSQIIRASATGDHYKVIEYKAEKAGKLKICDEAGNLVMEKEMAENNVAMITHFDRQRVKELIIQTLNNAQKSGRSNILFGFDEADPYYEIAISDLNDVSNNYQDLNIEVMTAAAATVRYFTKGEHNTVLQLNNIYGDFATDIELSGKGTSYSIGTIYDGRGVVELGSGGTAPDLLLEWKRSGILKFNPMSFIEGISLALQFSADKMPEGKEKQNKLAQAKAIMDAMYVTIDKGIVLPIVKGKFTKREQEEYKVVSTQTFIKSVELETYRILQSKNPDFSANKITKTEVELKKMIAIDAKLFETDAYFEKERLQDKNPASQNIWRTVNELLNNKLEQTGEIDIFNPDYTINFHDANPEQITPHKLLELQKSRADFNV